MPTRSRRVAAAVLAAGSASLALSACAGGAGTGASDGSSGGKPEIIVSMWANGEADTAALEGQLDIARKQNPDLTITLRTSPFADYFTKLTTDMASGNMACVAGMNSSLFVGYVDGFRALKPSDLTTAGVDLKDFARGSDALMSLDKQIYAVPTDISTMIMYTNKDLLSAAGVKAPADGWTYDEFHSAATEATRDGKFGFAVGVSTNSWMAIPISESGTQPVTDKGKLNLTNEKFVDAATRYGQLVSTEKISPEFPSAADTNFAQDQFLAGNIGMVVDGTWNASRYLGNESGFTAGLAPLPGGKTAQPLGMALGSGYGVSKTCKNPDAALKVMGSLVSKEALDKSASAGRAYPSRIASQPLYIASLPAAHQAEIKTVFDTAFAHVEAQRVTKQWSKLGTFMLPNLLEVYGGRTTMADLLASAQAQFGK